MYDFLTILYSNDILVRGYEKGVEQKKWMMGQRPVLFYLLFLS